MRRQHHNGVHGTADRSGPRHQPRCWQWRCLLSSRCSWGQGPLLAALLPEVGPLPAVKAWHGRRRSRRSPLAKGNDPLGCFMVVVMEKALDLVVASRYQNVYSGRHHWHRLHRPPACCSLRGGAGRRPGQESEVHGAYAGRCAPAARVTCVSGFSFPFFACLVCLVCCCLA